MFRSGLICAVIFHFIFHFIIRFIFCFIFNFSNYQLLIDNRSDDSAINILVTNGSANNGSENNGSEINASANNGSKMNGASNNGSRSSVDQISLQSAMESGHPLWIPWRNMF